MNPESGSQEPKPNNPEKLCRAPSHPLRCCSGFDSKRGGEQAGKYIYVWVKHISRVFERIDRPCSERRVKENIVRIGDHPLGFGLYLFDYRPEFRQHWGQGRQFGLMIERSSA